MPAVLDIESTLTDRYQTTVPEPVRRALKLGKRDKIQFSIGANGYVRMLRVADRPMAEDPVIGNFLAFLEKDMTEHPERLRPLDTAWLSRMNELVGDVQVELADLDKPLPIED